MQSEFIICGFYVPSQEDISLIQENIIKYPVKIFTEYEQIKDISYPIQIIGWEKTKKTFPNQNILDKKINNNLFWSFSSTEDKQKFFEDTEEFLFESIKKWFPDNFITYSSIFSKFFII